MIMSVVPIGTISPYAGVIADIPEGWFICDGANGTVNLTATFVYGIATEVGSGDKGGNKDSVTISHFHTATFTGNALAAHAHANWAGGAGAGSGSGGSSAFGICGNGAGGINPAQLPTGSVTTTADGNDGTDRNLPSFAKLLFIQRIA